MTGQINDGDKPSAVKAAMARREAEAVALRSVMTDVTVGIVTAGLALGVGRQAAYKGAESGEIPTIRVGREYRVPAAKLRAMLGLTSDTASAEHAAA